MAKRKAKRKTAARKTTPAKRVKAKKAKTRKARKAMKAPIRRPPPSPPSSLDLNRRGSAVRSGRAGIAHKLKELGAMSSAITGGDVDTDTEDAYFSGDEAPGGDNPTPDQDIVDDIGKALGVQYQDGEELKASDKVTERDKHRWELDPASAEDYKDRK